MDECAICLEPLFAELTMFECHHFMHSECYSDHHYTNCPMCRRELPPTEYRVHLRYQFDASYIVCDGRRTIADFYFNVVKKYVDAYYGSPKYSMYLQTAMGCSWRCKSDACNTAQPQYYNCASKKRNRFRAKYTLMLTCANGYLSFPNFHPLRAVRAQAELNNDIVYLIQNVSHDKSAIANLLTKKYTLRDDQWKSVMRFIDSELVIWCM
jgi:hypothetical protein